MGRLCRYQSRDTEAQLHKAERDLKQLENVIADTKSRIQAMQTRISATDKKLADSNAVLRNFQDNLRLRRERKNLTQIDNELEGLDEAGARKAYREFETKYNDQRQRQTDKQAKVSVTAGKTSAESWGTGTEVSVLDTLASSNSRRSRDAQNGPQIKAEGAQGGIL